MTTISVSLQSDRLSEAAVQDMARGLNSDLARHTDAQAELHSGPAIAHGRGEPITMGMLMVTFMTSGTAVAVVKLLQSYLQRDRSLSMTVELADGSKTTLTAASAGDIESMAKLLAAATGQSG